MEIIPVLDIKEEVVVQAIRGERDKYRPIEHSNLIRSNNPIKVAKAFIQEFNFRKFYIADLDSIEGKGNNFKFLKELKRINDIETMVDIGIKNKNDLNDDVLKSIDYLILGTETLESLEVIKYSKEKKKVEKLIISIDLKNDKIITRCKQLFNPEAAIEKLYKLGIINFILLDLMKVGSLQGPSLAIQKLIKQFKHLNLFIGGGIRTIKDITDLEEMGIAGVLIGTAFHKGCIKKEEIIHFCKR